jgi:hypothetical protein
MVEIPEVIEARLIGHLPDGTELRGVRVLIRELESYAYRVHTASLAASAAPGLAPRAHSKEH